MRAEHAAIGVLAVLLFAPLARAQEAPAVPPPDLEFLEYLGSLVREGDAWVDPADLREPGDDEPERAAEDRKNAGTPQQAHPDPQKEQ